MKGKILKTLTVLMLIAVLTLINFIYVGTGFISLAAESSSTNHKNIEFTAELKDENILTLAVTVKNEGYFNGEITLENSNFKLKNTESEYVNKIEGNKITLNQINAGTTASFDVEIEPVKDDILDTGLLSAVSDLNLTGIYRDSTEKDINIKATREARYEYLENNNEENVENGLDIITNKIFNINGEDKRIVQISMNMGLKENNYPIEEMTANVILPEEEKPEVVTKTNFNTMTYFEYNYSDNNISMEFTNKPNEENKVIWKKTGCENVILTLVYNKDVDLVDMEIPVEETVKLFNGKELKTTNTIKITEEEKDNLMQVTNTAKESVIYKGKINASLDRSFETETTLKANLSNSVDGVSIKEGQNYYNTLEEKEILANIVYNKTVLEKEDFDKILGENGEITILNENGETLGVVNSQTQVDENGNIVIDYTGKEPSSIEIKTTTPIKEGDLVFTHIKTIKQAEEGKVINAVELASNVSIDYGTGVTNTSESRIKLENAKTEADLEVNKDTLSTVIANDVEIRATLKSNNEQYNLFENPVLTFELPEAVENITINNIDLIYETELSIANYTANGRTITVELAGKQTNYKEPGIEGAILVINASVNVNRKSATQDSKIIITCINKEETVSYEKGIRIVAPKDMTVIHNISELGVETIGEEENTSVKLEKGQEAKEIQTQIEVINNNENKVENVKVLGTFPTRNDENNIDINIKEGLNVSGVEGARVYYTENENATEDLQNSENGWQEEITDGTKVRKYLIEVPEMETGSEINATYKSEVPELLEYNQKAQQDYKVNYQNSSTKTIDEIKATNINLETGVGPNLETKISATISGNSVENSTSVKNGEVIRYKVEVSNIGSEDVANVKVQGSVPEGTTLVEPEDHFEYAGSSYYKELENKIYESTIDSIKVGESKTLEYEVRVNNDTPEGTTLINKATINYGDAIKESNENSLVTSNGNIRVTVKRVTDRGVNLYEAGTVQYFTIVENISNEVQNNVVVKTNLPDCLQVNRLKLITNMKSQNITDEDLMDTDIEGESVEITEEDLTSNENIQTENIEYQNEINIGTIKPGQNKVLSYDMEIQKMNNKDNIEFSAIAKTGETEYRSNIVTDNVRKIDISLSMVATPEERYVKSGDVITYKVNIKNNNNQAIEGLILKDTIPNSLYVNKVTFNGEEITELKNRNNLEISINMSGNNEVTIEIETVVNYSAGRVEAEAITNVASVEFLSEKIANTAEITYIIEANDGSTTTPGDDNGNNDSENDNNEVDDNDIAKGTGIITGIAWFDENSNGQKDENEQLMSGVKVRLYNTETNNLVKQENGDILEATTNGNGVYVLDHIGNGKYIVIFDYDNSIYTLTKYKVEGVSEVSNSDAIMKELTINGESKNVASTDILELSDENISDINIGFVKVQNFDLKLEKFVSRIVIQDSSGSSVVEFDDETLARAELDAKRIDGATVLIEYKIRVSNVGDASGYVRRIADYMPNDLKFSSELNKDWYQTQEGLYNSSLANEIINPGESRELTLTLTKSMTENNAGLINNTAEIDEDYNELGLADSNSTPGNRVNGENDMGSADVLLGIRTGGGVYIGIAIGILAVLGVIAVIIIKKRKITKGKI